MTREYPPADPGTTTPRLRAGVGIHATDDESGFLETPHTVRRLQGTKLATLAQNVLPLLDGTATVEEISRSLPPSVAPTDLRALLDGLRAQGLLADQPSQYLEQARSAPAGDVLAVGGDPLLTHVTRSLAGLPGVRVHAVADEPDTETLTDILAEQSPALVVVVTPALLDPWPGRINQLCVGRRQPCLFVGLDSDAQAFVGPLWTADRLGACFECLRARLHTNSTHGGTRLAYQRYLRRHDVRPVLHSAPAPAAAHLAGWAAWSVRRWLAGTDDGGENLLWLDCDELSTTRHLLLEVPTCEVCGEHQRNNRHLVRTVGDIDAAQDERVGIVHSAAVHQATVGPRIHLAGTTSADMRQLRPALRVVNNGGAGYTVADATRAGLGESLERYAAGLYRGDDLVLSSWKAISGVALHPRELGLFSAVQYSQPGFPFVPFDEDTTVRWTRSVRWHDRAEVWVPASQVYLPYRRVADEAFVAPSISTGLAAGPTFEAAVLGGLYEVLERDALAISWLHRLPPRRVPGAAVAASADVSAHLAEARSWTVRFYDLSLDFSPAAVVAVMEYQNGDERVMSFGSACRLSCTHAVEKAFLEAAQGVGYVRALLHTYEDWTADPDFGNVDDFHKHAILYSKHPELRPRVRYLLDPSTMPADRRPPRIDTPAAGGRAGSPQAWTLAMLTEQLHAAGHPVLVVDLTTSDIRQLGVSVVRVLVPGLQHLAGAHRFRLLGNPRLHDVVGRLGYDSAPDNPYPHPLP